MLIRDTKKYRDENPGSSKEELESLVNSMRSSERSHSEVYLRAKRMAEEFRRRTIDNNEDEIIEASATFIGVLPEEAEVVEVSLDGENIVSSEMLERAKELVRNRRMQAKRDFDKIYKHGNIEIAIANDGTAWYLNNENPANTYWKQMFESGYPELPQD